MQRQIKFKGKTADGKGLYGDLVQSGRNVFIIPWGTAIWRDSYDELAVNPATVAQYTGLKDKHGAEIYEHDVLGKEHGAKAYDKVKKEYCIEIAVLCRYKVVGDREGAQGNMVRIGCDRPAEFDVETGKDKHTPRFDLGEEWPLNLTADYAGRTRWEVVGNVFDSGEEVECK